MTSLVILSARLIIPLDDCKFIPMRRVNPFTHHAIDDKTKCCLIPQRKTLLANTMIQLARYQLFSTLFYFFFPFSEFSQKALLHPHGWLGRIAGLAFVPGLSRSSAIAVTDAENRILTHMVVQAV